MRYSLVRLINKYWTHTRDDEGDFGIRALIHIPIGFLMGITFVFGWGLLYMFCKYQRNEDAHTEDEAWKDYFGAIVGYTIGLITLMGLLVYFLYHFI